VIHIDITKAITTATGTKELCINTKIQQHEFIALTGESGSGKTTLLRILAGLEDAHGSIVVNGSAWMHNGVQQVPLHKRNIGFVFQDYALFDNMTIEQNLLFVANDTQLCQHLLEITQLWKIRKRYSKQLSGGQKQRVALARALMQKPQLLLLDEPLSALDKKMRIHLQQELKKLHKELQLTTVMVTHDMSDVYHLASRVFHIENGYITPHYAKKMQQKLFGEIIQIIEKNGENIAIVNFAHQLIEVLLNNEDHKDLQIGDTIALSLGEPTSVQ